MLSIQFRQMNLRYLFSSLADLEKHKHCLYSSKFHQLGFKHFKRTPILEELMKGRAHQLQKLQTRLVQKRQSLLSLPPIFTQGLAKHSSQPEIKVQTQSQTELQPQIKDEFRNPQNLISLKLHQQYTDIYVELMTQMRINVDQNERLWKIAGWYNMIPFKEDLLIKLISGKVRGPQLVDLIDCLSWMDFKQIDQDFAFNNGEKIGKLYKNLPKSTDLAIILQLQRIVSTNVQFEGKKSFLNDYMRVNLDKILQKCPISSILQLFQIYVKSLNDDQLIINKIQQRVIKQDSLDQQNCLTIMRTYTNTGGMHEQIFSKHIKPYMSAHKLNSVDEIAEGIALMLKWECKNQLFLQSLIDKLDKMVGEKGIPEPTDKFGFHLSLHYLLIFKNKLKVTVPSQWVKHYDSCCLSLEKNSLFMTDKLKSRSRSKGKLTTDVYVSSCVSPVLPSKYHPAKSELRQKKTKFPDYDLYKSPSFCLYRLSFAFQHPATLHSIAITFHMKDFKFKSGKLFRSHQMRCEMLNYYGWECEELDYADIERGQQLKYEKIAKNNQILQKNKKNQQKQHLNDVKEEIIPAISHPKPAQSIVRPAPLKNVQKSPNLASMGLSGPMSTKQKIKLMGIRPKRRL